MCNYEESELAAARRHMKELQTAMAAQMSKIACLEKFVEEKEERNKLLKRRPREGFCVFNSEGMPELWTVRCREQDAIRRWKEYTNRSWEYYLGLGYSVGPCIVKPVIRTGG